MEPREASEWLLLPLYEVDRSSKWRPRGKTCEERHLPMSPGLWPRGTRGLLEGSSIQTLREEQRKLSQNESEDGGMAGEGRGYKGTAVPTSKNG